MHGCTKDAHGYVPYNKVIPQYNNTQATIMYKKYLVLKARHLKVCGSAFYNCLVQLIGLGKYTSHSIISDSKAWRLKSLAIDDVVYGYSYNI